jgi:hypothetical protein
MRSINGGIADRQELIQHAITSRHQTVQEESEFLGVTAQNNEKNKPIKIDTNKSNNLGLLNRSATKDHTGADKKAAIDWKETIIAYSLVSI